uniref:RNA-directed DNA polymerase n=3 Tax=Photinus pyralis TaxID=7054 RepID=A0A1Y1LT42_PHOPY
MGSYRGPPVSFSLDKNVKPIMLKARKVPFALKDKIEVELDRLIAQGVLEPITHPKWCTPIVTVCKENGEVRICGDYKSTLNSALNPEPYSVPSVQSIISTLAGGKVFAKLDMAQAYLQLSVNREAAEAQTIITHKGAFKCNRLQFGISVAPQIFQKFIDNRLSGISGVLPYYDDILLVGSSEIDLDSKVRAVLSRFREDGLHLRKEKCVFRTKTIEFLGFRISEDGLRPTKDKIAAITNAPQPKNKTELQAFLGLLNFYHVFLKDKATIANPLHALLRKDVPWQWRSEERTAFALLKDSLAKEPVLGHYSEQKDLYLTCDASPYGVGCVLSQRDDEGREYPVAYHSRTLSSAERNFAQIDKEALAIISGIKKFHEYVYGRKITIKTDHKPLLGIFNPRKGVPEILSPRMLRWALMISAYDYDLVYVPGSKIQNADALSRLPQKVNAPEPPSSDDVLMLENIPEKLICAKDIANETKKDPVLSKVLQWVWKGWPDDKIKFSEEFTPYLHRKNEISCYQDCLLWGTRVIVPLGGRKTVLNLLHSAHPGIVKMKSLARSYVWWPYLDKQIEHLVNTCGQCQESRNMPKKSPIHPWEWARAPWTRIHLDFAGPFKGKMFLIIIDSYSKWLEVKIVPNTSSAVTIDVLRGLFATHGVPDVVVSDNGTSFTSEEFQKFLKKNLIRQALVAPYHPSSNGQAERMVQNVKNALKKMTDSNEQTTIQLALHRYLLSQHITPHCETGRCPSEILMGRKLGSLFDRLQPNFRKEMLSKQETKYPSKEVSRCFQENDTVFARSFTPGQRWLPSKVIETTGPLSYKVQTPDGKMLRRHTDQLRNRVCGQETTDEVTPSTSMETRACVTPTQLFPQPNQIVGPETETVEQAAEVKKPPARVRKPPRYLEDYDE